MLESRGRDQAEGLRRILGGQQPRRLAVLSAVTSAQKNAILLNLAAALVNAGSEVQLLDTSQSPTGISVHAKPPLQTCLWRVAQRRQGHELAVREHARGVRLAKLSEQPLQDIRDATDLDALSQLLRMLRPASNFWLIDVQLEQDNPFVLPEIAQSELIVLVSSLPNSIKLAYAQIKALQAQLGQRPCHLLVVGSTGEQAELIQQNMAMVASRYLALTLSPLGSIPADEQLAQAELTGCALVDTNPVAEASAAFRKVAAQLIGRTPNTPDALGSPAAALRA